MKTMKKLSLAIAFLLSVIAATALLIYCLGNSFGGGASGGGGSTSGWQRSNYTNKT
ncbi:MAG: hypothetical protein Q4A54_11015 [Parabacteroides sp.]|nr:hypothetical protein [Parabacteroides sp.]